MIDLHMHTVYSDGDKTVAEILKLCEDKKLEYISITDHDSCKQYEDEAIKNNTIFTRKIIKGTELQAIFENKKFEILAYNIDTNIMSKWLEKYYSEEKLIEKQKIGYEKLLNVFDKQGIIYEKEKIEKPKKSTEFIEKFVYEEAMRHPENYKKLGDGIKNYDVFYRKCITNVESPFFVEPIGRPRYEEVIDIIHNAGGKAFLAHPIEYEFENILGFIDELKSKAKLDGIECFHPSASKEQRKVLLKYAKENNLYISGGSDYHGKLKPDIEIGIGRGDINIPKEILEWL
jgi:hypothetical protein